MPIQSVRFFHHSHLLTTTILSLLTNRVFWAVISFFTNLVGFILVCSSSFLVDQFGKELRWSFLTVFLVGIYIVPTLLFCTLLWGPQIKNKLQNNLLLRVVLIYFCFIVVCVASHLDKNPRFHIKVEDQDGSNSRKVYNLLSSGAFALTALGLSKAIDLQFEIGFFFYFLGDAMVVSLGIVGKNGQRNWNFILATGIFCFLLIFLRCDVDLLTHERHTSNPTGQRRTQPPDPSTNITIESMANGDIEASQSRTTQAKANINGNPSDARQSRIQIYSRASMVNEGSGQIETRIRQESWLVDEDQWEIISPSVDMETSTSSGEFEDDEDDDVPLLRSPRSRVVKEEQEDTETSVSPGEFEDDDVSLPRSPRTRAVKEEDMETSNRSGEFEDDEDKDVPLPCSPRSKAVKEEDHSTQLASSKPSSVDEGTSTSLCAQMEKTISFHSGGYEEDDVSLRVSMIDGSVDQGQTSVDSEKDANTYLATSAPASSDDKENGHHDHRIDCDELRVDTREIAGSSVDSEEVDVSLLPKVDRIEAESRIMNTELGDREPKSRSRSSIITRSMSSEVSGDMHPSNLHLADFYLGTCGHCKCALAPLHDIYMYRGNVAFCSLRCRLQQLKQEERKQETDQQMEHGKRKGHCLSSPTVNEHVVHIFFICNWY